MEAKPETSLSDTADASGPVGLSDPQYVAQRRKMLDTVNRLRATGSDYRLLFSCTHLNFVIAELTWNSTSPSLRSWDRNLLESRRS
jgi:hypothetical protein